MAKKKTGKIPYKEYQALKEKDAKRKFKISLYPWPVLATILIPTAVLILLLLYYLFVVKTFPE